MQARLKQDLVRIDVADPGDEILTQKEGLYRASTPGNETPQIVCRKRGRQRFHTKRPQTGNRRHAALVHEIHMAKSPLVDEPQVEAACAEHEPCVWPAGLAA